MKSYVTNTADLVGKKITGVFICNDQLIVATEDNFAVFEAIGGDGSGFISEDLGVLDLKYRASHYNVKNFIAAGLITQEEIDEFKREREEIRKREIENNEKNQILREIFERDRLNKKYPAESFPKHEN